MLVLTRKENEAIQIGSDITVIVVKIGNGRVRIGIEAPEGISIHRPESFAPNQARVDLRLGGGNCDKGIENI